MSTRWFPIALIVSGAAAAALVTACFAHPDGTTDDDDLEGTSSNVEAVDPLEGAYIKQGGTALQFVFKKGDTKADPNTFFGQIDDNGTAARASGTVVVGRDNLGTKFTLTRKGGTEPAAAAAADETADPDAGTDTTATAADAVTDSPLVDKAFNGTVHFLRIGQNNSILVRKDDSNTTSHYKKARSWCAKAADCSATVQRITDMTCDDSARACTNSKCACASSAE